ncbi:MAG: hypothetical protein OEN21_05970 [Myxococcales bacterium]|nr:hypothetical protein [Myxococcales bacterium]
MPSPPSRRSLALLCLGILVACGSDDRRQADALESIELSAIIQSLGPLPESVEYSVRCLGDEDSTAPGEVKLDGELAPAKNRDIKTGMLDVPRSDTWTSFIDLPPGSCWMQVRGHDDDGEVICTAQVPFSVVAGTATRVVVPLSCPSAGLPLFPETSFNVCPNLLALRCDELDPLQASTSCLVSFLDCTGDGTPDASCTIRGDTPGARIEVTDTIVADFFVECVPPASGGMPGATITCTAVTSDGDLDCDVNRVVTVDCPDPEL